MSQRGFTLIEVLVASAIFVGVMVIGVSSFSNVNHINDQIQVTRNLSQTGNFVMETLARDIRTATGLWDPTSNSFHTDFPFDFISDPNNGMTTNGQISTTALKTRTCPVQSSASNPCMAANLVTHIYFLLEKADHTKSFVLDSAENSLLPSGINMKDISFTGLNHSSVTVQPFVTIKFTLVDALAPDPAAPSAQQTFQTTVTSLVYSGQ